MCEWVKISESLPTESCFIYLNEKMNIGIGYKTVSNTYLTELSNPIRGWTHWMSLPKPPKD